MPLSGDVTALVDVHFTLWPGLTVPRGSHGETTWDSFRAFVAEPPIQSDRKVLEGWSPARFAGNRRAAKNAELVSAIVLDDDETGLALERVAELWSFSAGLIHTTHSHTEASPRYRIVLRTSRDMTADEHARVWCAVRDVATARGQRIDESTKDPSRFWFVPARRSSEAPYAWRELPGAPLDVDAILSASEAAYDRDKARTNPSADEVPSGALPSVVGGFGRRKAMAAALGAAWPSKGRHAAHLALAGALRAEGFPQDEALDFLCAVCAAAGDEDRAKRAKTIEHTYALDPGAPMTSWSRLKLHVDPAIVDAARGVLGRDASWTEAISRRMAEAAASAQTEPTPVRAGRLVFETGGYDAELPPIDFQVDGLIEHGDVVMLVAMGNSLKTWLAFSLANAVASGEPWLGKYLTHRGRAALVDFESGAYEVRRRLKILGVRDATVGDRLLRVSYPEASFVDPETWVELAGAGSNLVVIDSFAAAAPNTDENDARAALMLQYAGRFAEQTRCTVLVIHHARKGSGDAGDAREAVRGSTALYAACDRVYLFKDVEKKDGGIVLSTMTSIKDGAGRAPADVRVELSDKGLRYVEPAPEAEAPAEPTDIGDRNRAKVLGILKARPAGVQKSDLIDMMHGRHEQRRECLAQMKLAEVTIEFRESTGFKGPPTLFVRLNE